ncbi:Vacuolar protein sorting-associated protein 5 [Tulasnella sp. 427]|nr:Vacuolar protein sorting-associated protein 5 [Tulasnella sp. 427]
MSDFDDLLPSHHRSNAAPTFDNPFQDVFDRVSGRPRSPDPWSTGGWGEPDLPPVSSYNAVPPQPASPPLSPGGFKEYTPSAQSYYQEYEAHHHYEEEARPQTPPLAPPPAHEEEPPKPAAPPLDPLGGTLKDEDEAPAKRNPLGPLPPAPKLPDLPPPPAIEKPAPAAEPAHPPEEEDKESTPVPPPQPATPVVVQPTPPSTTEQRADAKPTALPPPAATNGTDTQPRIVPAIPPSPLTPYPGTPPTVADRLPRDRAASDTTDSNSLAATDSTANIKYDRIVSPLETPPATIAKRTSLEQGFGDLALGGETSAWGGLPPPSGPSASYASYDGDAGGFGQPPIVQSDVSDTQVATSPSQSVATVKDDDDDDKPLIPPPVFVITVGDPQKVGDPLSAHIVYTVHTRTTSPAFTKSTFSVLRRYSDFLWLYETLSANNPGVIVPPVPEKNPFNISRFETEFVETRRLGLNKCVQKIANHPVLNKDQDFRFFLESDSFALDIKHRRGDGSSGGLLASFGSFTAPRFYEIDDWFDHKRAYLDALESQLKGLVKAMDVVSKQRNDFAIAISEFADTIAALSLSDLSKQLTQSLSMLAEVERLYKDMQETQGKDDIITIMGTADEYSRLINSVRLSFNSRIKLYFAWQSADTECRRIKSAQEKARRQGRTTGSMVEIAEAERRAQEAKREFDDVTKLIKMELARFERERIEDFKVSMEEFLETMIRKQKALLQAWENYQNVLLKRASANPTPASGADAEEAEAI